VAVFNPADINPIALGGLVSTLPPDSIANGARALPSRQTGETQS